MATSKSNFWSSPLTRSHITSDDVKMPEMLLGYFIGPFGALLSSGIFTSILQNYFTDVLKLDLGFLTTLQLISTVLIVAANLVVGQLIERTRALAVKFIDVSASCRLMQSVNILCHNSLQFPSLLQFCQFQMGSIWLRIQNHHLLFIELIESFRIFHKKAVTDHLFR